MIPWTGFLVNAEEIDVTRRPALFWDEERHSSGYVYDDIVSVENMLAIIPKISGKVFVSL